MSPQILNSFGNGILKFIIFLIRFIICFILNLFKLIINSILEPLKFSENKNQATTTTTTNDIKLPNDIVDYPLESKRKFVSNYFEAPTTIKKSNTFDLLDLTDQKKNIAFDIFDSPEIENPSLFKYKQINQFKSKSTINNPSLFKYSKLKPTGQLFEPEHSFSNNQYTTDELFQSAILSNSDGKKFKSPSRIKINNEEYFELDDNNLLCPKLVKFKETKSINDLKCELLMRIFKELELIDLLKCRIVSKKWCVLIMKSCIINCLCIIDPFISNRNSTWFHANKSFNLKNCIYFYPKNPLPLNYLESELFKTFFNKIKYLSLSYQVNENNGFVFEVLNRFKCLVHLDIHSLSIKNKNTLNLPNLNTLSIHKFDSSKPDLLNISSSKLMNLKCENNLSKIKFKYLNSIKYIETNQCTDNDLRCLKTFANLEILVCGLENNKIKLDMLPINLKELNLFWDYNSNGGVKDMMFLGELFDKKNKQLIKIHPLEITIDGIKINNRDELEKFNQEYFVFLRPFLQLKFHSILVKSSWLKEIGFNKSEYGDVYNCLFNKLEKNQKLSIDIFTKLNNLQVIKIWDIDVNDEDGLLAFLDKFTKITYVKFKNIALSQEFYEMLPMVVRQINYLDIYQSKNEIDFDNFLPKLTYLIRLSTDQQLNISTADYWFKISNHLHCVKARNENLEYFQIQRVKQFRFKYEYEYNYDSKNLLSD